MAGRDLKGMEGKGKDSELLSGSALKGKKSLEVLYPGEFLATQPWDQGEPLDPSTDSPKVYPGMQNISIPILELSHITHNKQAAQIRKVENYKFESNKKVGRTPTPGASPYGTTYKKIGDHYSCIPGSGTVFPGYLSWWGISTNQWYKTYDEGQRVKKTVSAFKESRAGVYVAEYLTSPASSKYGNNAFLISLNNLMSSYKISRSVDNQVEKIYLKKGGTLRYQNEICYVIVVCVDEDNIGMPSINGREIFIGNGYINEDGMVLSTVDDAKFPYFHVKHPITCESYPIYPNPRYYRWDSLAFAFYFPKEEYLKCDKKHVHVKDILHAEIACVSKKSENGNGSWPFVCANRIAM